MAATNGTPSPLAPELVSVLHHIELNQSGWWEKTIDRILEISFAKQPRPVAASSIGAFVREEFGLTVDSARLHRSIERLVSAKKLLGIDHEGYQLSHEAKSALDEEVERAKKLTDDVKELFIATLHEKCPELDGNSTWIAVSERLLLPMIRELGAKTREILMGDGNEYSSSNTFNSFLISVPNDHQDALKATLLAFLSPANAVVRDYVLRHLNFHFVIEAASLDDSAIRKLFPQKGLHPSFDIFVDANFAIALLGLDNNTSKEIAESLVDLSKRVRDRVTCNLYISTDTLKEVRTVITYHRNLLRNISLSGPIVEGAIEASRGFTLNFLERHRASGGTLTADAYYAPYIEDLEDLLFANGITVRFIDSSGKSVTSTMTRDISTYREFEAVTKQQRPKSQNQLRHDVTLWRQVTSLRPQLINNVLDANSWIVTIDRSMIQFDGFVRRKLQKSFPTCANPTTMVQLLQLWIPRSAALESAVVNSLRLPLLALGFDYDAERVTLDILRAISRFEQPMDLSPKIVEITIRNKALRSRLSEAKTFQQKDALVREVLLIEHKDSEEKRVEAERRLGDMVEVKSSLAADFANIERQLSEAVKEKNKLQEANLSLAQQVRDSQAKSDLDRRRGAFISNWVLINGLCVLVIGLSVQWFISVSSLSSLWFAPVLRIADALIIFGMWITAAVYGGNRLRVDNFGPHKVFQGVLKVFLALVVLGFIVGMAAGVAGNYFSDAIKERSLTPSGWQGHDNQE